MQKGKAKTLEGKMENDGGMPLKELEALKGFSIEEVIEKLKRRGVVISNNTYRSWRDNKVNFHRQELLSLADIFGVSVDYLLGRADLSWQKSKELAFPWRLRRIPVGEEQELVKTFKLALQGKELGEELDVPQLEQVIDDGLIELDIDFGDSESWDFELQEKLKKKFGMRAAFIPAKPIPKALSLIVIGEIAAKFFIKRIKTGRVSLSSGSTIARMVMSLRRYRLSGLELFPLEMFPMAEKVAISSSTLCGMFELFHFRQVHSRGLRQPVGHGQLEDASPTYLGEIKRLLSEASGLENAAMVGIGPLERFLAPTTLLHIVLDALSMNVDELVEKHLAVGDILFRVIDINGNEVDHPINRFVLSVDLDRLRTMAQLSERPIVAVAASVHKAKAVYGVLKGKYVNTLILDKALAEKVIEYAETEEYKGRLSERVKKIIKQKALERVALEIVDRQSSWVKRIVKLAMELSEKEREAIIQIKAEQNLEEVKQIAQRLDIFNRMRRELEDRLTTDLLRAGIKPSDEKAAIRLIEAKMEALLRKPLMPPETSEA